MFSARSFTWVAISATACTASGVKSSVTPSVRRSAVYCLRRALSGSVRILTKSARESGSSSTRMGKRPWSSGMRSAGFATWNAPAATKSTWSVRTTPYLVVTAVPSTIGRRSRWTPSRDTSGP